MVDHTYPVIFNQWLKHRRKALDMTQDELAMRAGCSVSALRKIESGERRPSKQLAGLLAEALELSSEERQTFIRVARGELNIERLPQPGIEQLNSFSEFLKLQETQPGMAGKSASPGHQIPLPTTTLIGREAEISTLERLFSDSQCRLLTLTGIGGIGKTRLAIEFALRNEANFPGGIFYIPLTPLKSPKEIISAIADVLDFRFFGSTEPKEQLINFIAGEINQEALLVFDNLEHLLVKDPAFNPVSGAAELVSEFLQRLPMVKILGTSRERMNLQGEWMYDLHGLSVPPENYVGQLEEYGSIELFVRSARRIKPGFEIDVDQQASLVQLCQLVEGVPLAVELAASWVCVLSCQEIAQEIKASMDFLSSSMLNIPERHRSIRATFEHSWKLLPDEERAVLCQLAVFKGGFERKAGEQIAGATLDLLASLNSKSLVHRTEDGRYDLHEVVRTYALAHLDDYHGKHETFTRHCKYYLRLTQESERRLKSAEQQEAVRGMTVEIDNIRAAWVWAINHQEFEQIDSATRGFGWYFEITGLYREGIEQLGLLVQALKDVKQGDRWCRILGMAYIHQALLNFRKGEFDQAQQLYEKSISILRPVGDQALLADALIFLGTILYLNGDYARSRKLIEEGLFAAREGKDAWFEAFGVFSVGHSEYLIGHFEEGYDQMMLGIAAWRKLGDPQSIALGLNFLVPSLIQLGRYAEAKAFMQESIALCEQSKNRWGLGTAYRHLGLACLADGQYLQARDNLLKSLEILGEFSEGWDIARSQTYLGETALMVGNLSDARQYYQDALQLSIEAHSYPIALDALLGLGNIQALGGEVEYALPVCYFVFNHPASEIETKNRAEKIIATLEANLTADQIKIASSRAKEATFEEFLEGTR